MMKKLSLLIILIGILILGVSARDANKFYVGLTGGYTYDVIRTDTGYRTDISYKGSHGFDVGIPFGYQITDYFGLSSGITYIQKNYRIEHYYPSYTIATPFEFQNLTNHYIELPLTLDFTLSNDIYSFTASAGGYIGYWVASQKSGASYGSSSNWAGTEGLMNYYSGTYKFTQADNRFEAGLLFRLGFELELDSVILFLRGSYSLGLTDMRRKQTINYSPLINDTIAAEVGMLWGFGEEKWKRLE